MPVVRMPNGDLVRFPNEMPKEQISQFIETKFPNAFDTPKPSVGDIFDASLTRGAENVASTLQDDLPAYLASIFGQDEYAAAQIEEGRARRQAAAEASPAQYGSYKDVESIGDAVGFVAEKFGENVPILGGLAASALTGAVAAPLLGVGAAAGAGIASALGSYSLMAPESFAGIYEETGTFAPGAASIAGAVNSALELVAPAQVLRSFSPSMRSGVVNAVLKKSGMRPSIAANAVKGVVKGAATEGTTEGTQEAVNIAAEKFVAENPLIFNSEDFKRITESAVAGAAVGLPLGGVGGVGRGITDRSQFKRDQAEAEFEAELEAQLAQTPEEEVTEETAEETVDEPVVVPEEKEQPAPTPNEVNKELEALGTEIALENESTETEVEALRRKATGFQTEKDTTYEEDVAERNAVDAAERQRKFEALQEVEEDIPQTKPLWSKDLLGFLSDNFAFSQEQFDEVQNFSEDEMQNYLDVIDEEYDNLKFDGPLVEDTSESIAESIADDSIVDEPASDGSNTLKDDADAKVVFDQLGIDEAGSFELSTAEFNARLKEANDRIKVIEEAAKKAKEPVTSKTKDGEFLTRKEGDILVDESGEQGPVVKDAPKEVTKKPVAKRQDELAYNKKKLPDKALQDLAVFKAANPKKEMPDKAKTEEVRAANALTGKQILANYLDAYDTPASALAAIAAEANNPIYSVNPEDVLSTTPQDAKAAVAYINKSMGKEVKQTLVDNENFIRKTLDDVKRRNAKEKTDKAARTVSKFGRDKKAEELKDVGAGTKGAIAVAEAKKKLVGETPRQIAKRINDEEAESLAGQKEGTTGTMGAEIRNAEKIARRTEETLAQQARSDEWIAFVESLPAKNQEAFLASYKKIAAAIADPKVKTLDGKPKPSFLLPESIRARVIAENKKGLSAAQKKRLVKFEEKFLLETPEYQGPKLNKAAELDLAENNLRFAIQEVIDGRKNRGEDKNVTSLIEKIKSLTVKTNVALDGPTIKARNFDPLKFESLEVQAGVEGKSLIEAAQFAANNAPNKDLQVLASALANELKRQQDKGIVFDFKVLHVGKTVPSWAGSLARSSRGIAGITNTTVSVVLNGADVTGRVGTSYKTLVHELFHAATMATINNKTNTNTAQQNAAVQDLTNLREFVLRNYYTNKNKRKLSDIERQFAEGTNNFFKNNDELVTWAMTSPEAAAYLESIPYERTNVFSAFVRIMRKMIGLPESADGNTALSEAMRVTEVLLGKNAVNAAMRKVQKIEGADLAATELPNFASGAYIPGLNTIVINTVTGLNEHTLLHESAHAALAQILDKPNHPITKKFMQFFADVKPKVGDAYGGTNIQEFAAEFVSNGEFQAILQRIKAPKSENMFVRILQTILEAFGIRKSQSAYDVTLKFLEELLDVSQGVEPTLADTLYLTNENIDKVIDDTINDSTDSFVTRNTEAALDTVSKIQDDKARVLALGAASLANMDNMYGENSPRYRNNNPLPIGRLMSFIERKRGEVNKAIDRTSKNIRMMNKAERKATAAQKREFNDIAIEARLESVDFLKPLPKNASAKQTAAYKKLNVRFNRLPKPMQASYKTLRKELDTYLEEYVELITEILPESSARELMKNFVNLEGVVAYVPFERTGEYYYRFKDPANLDAKGNPKDTPVAAESPRKRDIAVAALKKKYGQDFEIKQYDNIDTMGVPKGLPEGQFVTALVGEMRENNVDSAIIDQVYQQYVAMFPEKSIMQQFKRSKNLPGMDRDIVGAYSNVSIKWANKIANTRYNSQIETAMQEIRRTAKEYHGDNKSMMAASKALTKQEAFF